MEKIEKFIHNNTNKTNIMLLNLAQNYKKISAMSKSKRTPIIKKNLSDMPVERNELKKIDID